MPSIRFRSTVAIRSYSITLSARLHRFAALAPEPSRPKSASLCDVTSLAGDLLVFRHGWVPAIASWRFSAHFQDSIREELELVQWIEWHYQKLSLRALIGIALLVSLTIYSGLGFQPSSGNQFAKILSEKASTEFSDPEAPAD